MRELEKVARAYGQTKQAFVEAVVLAEIEEAKERKFKRPPRNVTPSTVETKDVVGEPLGLGIANARKEQADRLERTEEIRQQSPSTTAPVVVNVGNGASTQSSGDAIDRLASYVASADALEREMRLRNAVSILKVSAASDEEAKVLAARLDEVIATKTRTSEVESGSMLRTARLAFDKLVGIIGGGSQ